MVILQISKITEFRKGSMAVPILLFHNIRTRRHPIKLKGKIPKTDQRKYFTNNCNGIYWAFKTKGSQKTLFQRSWNKERPQKSLWSRKRGCGLGELVVSSDNQNTVPFKGLAPGFL